MKKFPESLRNYVATNWNTHKDNFLEALESQIANNPFPKAFSQSEMREKIKELEEVQKNNADLSMEKEKLIMQIEELKVVKDKNEFNVISEKYVSKSVIDEFESLLNAVKEKLNKFKPVVRAIIYNTKYNRDLGFGDEFADHLSDARSRKLIDSDNNALWDKKEMQDIFDTLVSLEKFIKSLDDSDYEDLIEKYPDGELDYSDLDFWEKTLSVKLWYNK